MTYYDLERHWIDRIVPHLQDKTLNEILAADFNTYTMGQFGTFFSLGQYPDEVETCSWRRGRRRPYPPYWRYVAYGACYWIVNFALHLATLAEPDRPWRIIMSEKHATVWDGDLTLFDFNYQALG